MGVLNFSSHCLMTFLILAELRSLGSSPIPMLPDFLNSRTSALPPEEKGQLSRGFFSKQGIHISTSEPPSAQDSVAVSRMPQRSADLNNLNSLKDQRALRAKQAFMQLMSRQSADDRLNSKSQQNNSGLSVLSSAQQVKPTRDVVPQAGENIPPNPAVHSKNSDQARNSVLLPHRSPVAQSHLPLKNGKDEINLGPLNFKEDICKPYPFKETVHHHGCNGKVEIENKMCYGQCNSFFIPKRFVSCSHCAPTIEETIDVRLECAGQNPDFVIKKVTIVKDCGCKDCRLEHS